MEQTQTEKEVAAFLIVAFASAWGLEIIGAVTGVALPVTSIVMFCPLLGALVSSRLMEKAPTGVAWKPRVRKEWPRYLVALIAPTLLSLAGAALFFLFVPGAFDPNMGYVTQAFAKAGVTGVDPTAYVTQSLVTSLVWAFFNMLFAVGEEAGWRGYMMPRLVKLLGSTKALVLGGLVWGAWHWPLIVIGGYEYGTGYAGAPFVGMAAMCLFTFALGTSLWWLYKRTGSIWPSALAHGAVNAIAVIGMCWTDGTMTSWLLGPTLAGLISVLPALVLAIVAARSLSRSRTQE